MADTSFISQSVEEVASGDANTRVSQDIAETAAGDANTRISQDIVEMGSGDSNTRVSQEVIEMGAGNSNTRISQLTIELGRGPEVVPPENEPASTFTVGAGMGLEWYIALQLSDSGIELRDKVVKSVRVTGKTTNGKVKVYGYGPKEDINVSDIEDGINQKVLVILENTTQVQQSKRHNINVKNAMTSTVRIEGIWSGEGIPDRVDESIMEISQQGIRR